MKWKKQVASLCLMLAMTVGMSAVSYAQFPFHLMIGSASPGHSQRTAGLPAGFGAGSGQTYKQDNISALAATE